MIDQLGMDGLGGASVRIDAFGCKQFTEEAMNGLQSRLAELEAEKKIRLKQLSDVTLRMRELEAENSRLLKVVEAARGYITPDLVGSLPQLRKALKEMDK